MEKDLFVSRVESLFLRAMVLAENPEEARLAALLLKLVKLAFTQAIVF